MVVVWFASAFECASLDGSVGVRRRSPQDRQIRQEAHWRQPTLQIILNSDSCAAAAAATAAGCCCYCCCCCCQLTVRVWEGGVGCGGSRGCGGAVALIVVTFPRAA
eukprot:scaffold78332_cov55-Phaeocystis_antarctica.AAC.2